MNKDHRPIYYAFGVAIRPTLFWSYLLLVLLLGGLVLLWVIR